MVDVKLYTKSYCPYCQGALGLLKELGVKYENIDVTSDDSKLKPVQKKENYYTVPMIYVKGKFIGGFSDLQELVDSGKVEKLINPKK